ncbi:MAG: tetratricopeptide repeat protein, partial [Myxococcota bacterium]|nr:tetratricopeptide repeat protein [Myxococcota bacterium]
MHERSATHTSTTHDSCRDTHPAYTSGSSTRSVNAVTPKIVVSLTRVRSGFVAFAIALAGSALASPAGAQEIAGGMPRAGEPSWGDYVSPERRTARQLRRDGLVRLLDALGSTGQGLGPPPEVLFEQALIRFERARRALPQDPDLLYFTALALGGWHRMVDGHVERRTDEAIAAYEELRRVDPDYHADRVAFELALLRSRRGEHTEAVAEYRRVIDAAMLDPAPPPYAITDRERQLARLYVAVSPATAHLNLAENTMMIGDLDSAIAAYRRAADLSSDDPVTRVLALWGLALALDRSGDTRDAMATARRAIQGDPYPVDVPPLGIDHQAHGPMAILHGHGVFFEPAYELDAYDAIGWEAMASGLSGADREELLRRARLAWTAYLTG